MQSCDPDRTSVMVEEAKKRGTSSAFAIFAMVGDIEFAVGAERRCHGPIPLDTIPTSYKHWLMSKGVSLALVSVGLLFFLRLTILLSEIGVAMTRHAAVDFTVILCVFLMVRLFADLPRYSTGVAWLQATSVINSMLAALIILSAVTGAGWIGILSARPWVAAHLYGRYDPTLDALIRMVYQELIGPISVEVGHILAFIAAAVISGIYVQRRGVLLRNCELTSQPYDLEDE